MKFTEARYDTWARLSSEINDRIDRACNLHNSLLKEADIPLSDDMKLHNGTLWLDDTHFGLDLDWSVTWRYGGHDSGSNTIPFDCLVDDTWEEAITRRANKTISKYRSTERTEKKQQKARDRAEYDRLKTKFKGDKS